MRTVDPWRLAACAAAATLALACGSSGPTHAGGDSGSDARDAAAPHDARPADHTNMDSPGTHDSGPDGKPPTEASSTDVGGSEASTDAAGLLTTLTGCLGPSMSLTLSGQMPYVDVPVGSESGEFVLDFGSTFSSIDLSAFASPGPTTSGCNPTLLGQVCTVAGFAFFAGPSSVLLTTESFSGIGGTVRQAGIIGTDFLSEHVITLSYAGRVVYASSSAAFCTSSALAGAGFVALTTKGFYENDLALLEPASDVDSSAPSGVTVPNVPTVPVRIGTATAIAQLDTGFDDDVTPFSVNVNEAFFTAIEAADPKSLTRDPSLDTTLTTCVSGVDEPVTGYRLAGGSTFDFVTVGGTAGRSYGSAALFVKNTPSAAKSCGGIGTWTVPAAQVAASFFNDMGALVFDPYGSQVWIPKR